MSAYDELQGGTVGEATARLLYSVVRTVAIDSRFPAPAGHDQWDADSIFETAHDFLAGDGLERIHKAAVLASDDHSLTRVLHRVVRNWFSDQARQTVKGRLARGIVYRLERMTDVIELGGAGSGQQWLHETGAADRSRVPLSVLVDVAYAATPGAAARIALEPRRGSALVEPAILEDLLRAVLSASVGPVDTGTLVEIVTARFPACDDPTEQALHEELTEQVADPTEFADIAFAERIWLQLSVDERRAVSLLDLPVRQIAETLGLSRNTAHRLAVRTRTLLTENTSGRSDAADIAAELIARSATMRGDEGGTDQPGLASSWDTGGEE